MSVPSYIFLKLIYYRPENRSWNPIDEKPPIGVNKNIHFHMLRIVLFAFLLCLSLPIIYVGFLLPTVASHVC